MKYENIQRDQDRESKSNAANMFNSAVSAIDKKFGPDYARKNPLVLTKMIDLLLAEKMVTTSQAHD